MALGQWHQWTDGICEYKEKFWIWNEISLKYIGTGSVDNTIHTDSGYGLELLGNKTKAEQLLQGLF